MLTFEVASFDIGYNCILGRHFLLKFMAVIHTAYNMMKMPGPKGVITIKADQRDTLACENTTKGSARTNSKGGEDAGRQHHAQVTDAQATDHRHSSTSFS
jgi:hypothetical protein